MAITRKTPTPRRCGNKPVLKCRFCRKHKKKCLPEVRQPGEKCKRCHAGGHDCGPPEAFVPAPGRDPAPLDVVATAPLLAADHCTQHYQLHHDHRQHHQRPSPQPDLVDGFSSFDNSAFETLTRSQGPLSTPPHYSSAARTRSEFDDPSSVEDTTLSDTTAWGELQPTRSDLFDGSAIPFDPLQSTSFSDLNNGWAISRSTIASKLESLSIDLEVLCFVRSRKRAAAAVTPKTRLPIYEDVAEALRYIYHNLHENFEGAFRSVSSLVKDAPESEKYMLLRRLYDCSQRYYRNDDLPIPEPAELGEESMVEPSSSLLHQLNATALQLGELQQARCYRRRHAEIRASFVDQAVFFQQDSVDLAQRFRKLRIPGDYTRHLPHLSSGCFPPSHLALLARRPEVAHHIQANLRGESLQFDLLMRKLLHLAVEKSYLPLIEKILAERPDSVHDRDIFNLTPLCIAANVGNVPVFMRLVSAGARTDVYDASGVSLLSMASGHGHLAIVRYLLDNGIPPNDDPCAVWSPLHAAAAGGYLDVVKLLLDRGAPPGWFSGSGKLATHVARDNRHGDIAALLDFKPS